MAPPCCPTGPSVCPGPGLQPPPAACALVLAAAVHRRAFSGNPEEAAALLSLGGGPARPGVSRAGREVAEAGGTVPREGYMAWSPPGRGLSSLVPLCPNRHLPGDPELLS